MAKSEIILKKTTINEPEIRELLEQSRQVGKNEIINIVLTRITTGERDSENAPETLQAITLILKKLLRES